MQIFYHPIHLSINRSMHDSLAPVECYNDFDNPFVHHHSHDDGKGGSVPMANVYPVIVLPGITGVQLRDEYQMPPDVVWGLLQHDFPRSALHPDNLRYEALEPARVEPDTIFDAAYKELVQELRHNLCEREDEPVPVFPFGYDWRQPLETIEQTLDDFIGEVIERTKLLRHYADGGYAEDPKVNLVGHSMGGLVITDYLARKGRDARVAKVATLGTPYRGSFEAVIKITTGTANLGTQDPSSRERETARMTPSLYYLMPTIEGDLEIDGSDLPNSLFDPRLWQASVTGSIAEFVRLHSTSKKNSKKDIQKMAQNLLTNFLQAAQAHRNRVNIFQLANAGLQATDWLCVVGVNAVTRVRMRIAGSLKDPQFDLGSAYRLNEWNSGNLADRHLTGDGTVPFDGALPAFLPRENVVCVTPEDFGYWEVQDKLLTSVAGFHGIMPNMDMLQRLIVRHFTGRPDAHNNTWGWPAPGVTQWNPPLPLHNKAEG
jgi:pimeloyl-ACP methyl ester carboxylesterase